MKKPEMCERAIANQSLMDLLGSNNLMRSIPASPW